MADKKVIHPPPDDEWKRQASKLLNDHDARITVNEATDLELAAGGMLSATYDPNEIEDDAFDMDNMVDGTTNKVMTATQETNFETAYTHSQAAHVPFLTYASVATTPYAVVSTDNLIDLQDGSSVVNLYAAASNTIRTIIRNNSGDTITVNAADDETVEDEDSFTLYDGEVLELISDTSSNWLAI